MLLRQRVERYACPSVLFLSHSGEQGPRQRLRAGPGEIAFFDDDFFYYLKIAMNLAAGRGSTFDGFHLTNGYHPLWLLILSGLAKLLPVSGVLFAVVCLVVVSTMYTYAFAVALFSKVTERPFAASLAATAIAFSAQHILHGGMEVTADHPLRARALQDLAPGLRFLHGPSKTPSCTACSRRAFSSLASTAFSSSGRCS